MEFIRSGDRYVRIIPDSKLNFPVKKGRSFWSGGVLEDNNRNI